MMPDTPALSTEDYQALHGMLLSEDAPTKAQGLSLAKKLTPSEQQEFFNYQQQVNKGKGELTRVDDQSPQILGAIGAGTAVARAAAAPGLSLVARGIAGAKAAAGQAAPIIKYQAVRSGLHAVGVPEPFATGAAYLASGYKKGSAPTVAAEAPVAAEMAPVAAVEAAPVVAATAKPTVAAILSDVDVARQEFAAGRLPKSVLDTIERNAAQKAGRPLGVPTIPSKGAAMVDRLTDTQPAAVAAPAPVAAGPPSDALPPTGTTAERAAILRQENSQIDAQGAAMRAQAAAAQPSAGAPIASPAPAGPATADVPRGNPAPTPSPAAIASSINKIVMAKGLKLSPTQVQSAYLAIKNEGLAPLDAVQREVLKQFAAATPGTLSPEQVAAEIAARQGNRSPVRP